MVTDTTMESDSKIPITIITGFLGSGKTTLLNHVMTVNHGKRVCVIQNEFGDQIGIESDMFINKAGQKEQEWLELPNGCICCTVKDDLVLTLEKLVERRDKFDYIFIETTGMADPGPLATSLWMEEEIDTCLYLDAIVTVVDSLNFLDALNEMDENKEINEAQRQVAFADVLLVNKCDLVDADKVLELQERIISINSIAPQYRTEHSCIDLDKILEIHSFDMDNIYSIDSSLKSFDNHDEHEHEHDHHDHHDHSGEICDHPSHADDVSTISVTYPGSIKLENISTWLADLLWDNIYNCKIYRTKGLISIQDETEKYVLQGVNDNFDIKPSGIMWLEDDTPYCKVVLIGKYLSLDILQKAFESACESGG
eukprot:TRINITY_DN5809_c0_g1_i1.p1 TRINITY_DN5809_c0_g1~~TRINITY_DN5809_c0_g1_i1.p1  ORF type:complete len:368 (+),score=96.57 TRINITY_DN5809_c0_g1_i1:41-1144(+)